GPPEQPKGIRGGHQAYRRARRVDHEERAAVRCHVDDAAASNRNGAQPPLSRAEPIAHRRGAPGNIDLVKAYRVSLIANEQDAPTIWRDRLQPANGIAAAGADGLLGPYRIVQTETIEVVAGGVAAHVEQRASVGRHGGIPVPRRAVGNLTSRRR